MSGSKRPTHARHRVAPWRTCACGCGSRVRSWSEIAYARGHRAVSHAESLGVTSLRSFVNAKNGRCAVCGGPFPDGSGCEFCPAVTDTELGPPTMGDHDDAARRRAAYGGDTA